MLISARAISVNTADLVPLGSFPLTVSVQGDSKMLPEIHERDIRSELCQRCASCCRIHVHIPKADSRYRQFLRRVGVRVLPHPKEGEDDCCTEAHTITLDLGNCQNLITTESDGGKHYQCRLYGSAGYPRLCAEYNCVSWAKYRDAYNSNNEILQAASRALKSLEPPRGTPT